MEGEEGEREVKRRDWNENVFKWPKEKRIERPKYVKGEKRHESPNVGGVSIRSRNCAPSRKGCVGQWSDDVRQAIHGYAPFPSPQTKPYTQHENVMHTRQVEARRSESARQYQHGSTISITCVKAHNNLGAKNPWARLLHETQ